MIVLMQNKTGFVECDSLVLEPAKCLGARIIAVCPEQRVEVGYFTNREDADKALLDMFQSIGKDRLTYVTVPEDPSGLPPMSDDESMAILKCIFGDEPDEEDCNDSVKSE